MVKWDKYYLDTPLIDLEQWISTWKRAKLRMNIISTSRLLIDDQKVFQNRWLIMKFWQFPNTTIFWEKIRKIFQNVVCWNFYPVCQVVNAICNDQPGTCMQSCYDIHCKSDLPNIPQSLYKTNKDQLIWTFTVHTEQKVLISWYTISSPHLVNKVDTFKTGQLPAMTHCELANKIDTIYIIFASLINILFWLSQSSRKPM